MRKCHDPNCACPNCTDDTRARDIHFTIDKGSEIRVTFDDGAAGIVLKPDGSSETFGEYKPDEAAAAFWQAVQDYLARGPVM